jgi:hypothetical protein
VQAHEKLAASGLYPNTGSFFQNKIWRKKLDGAVMEDITPNVAEPQKQSFHNSSFG